MPKYVYLAGAVTDHGVDDVYGWRDEVDQHLPTEIQVIYPTRHEKREPDGKYRNGGKRGGPNAILEKNLSDMHQADVVLAYMPRYLNDPWPSMGTIMEIMAARLMGKPCVLVTDDPRIAGHGTVPAACGWVVETLAEGVGIVRMLMEPFLEEG